MEVAFGCEDGFIGVWKLQGDPDEVVLRMVWRSGPSTLIAQDAVVVNTVGLSALNRQLLIQRGANDGSSSEVL